MEPTIEPKDVADALIHSVNTFSNKSEYADEVLHNLLYTHRTLNQAFTGRYVFRFIKMMSDNYKSGNYDGRNEFACKLCHDMANVVEEKYGQDLFNCPFI